MKRIIYVLAFVCMAIGAHAQHFTLWYGTNFGAGTDKPNTLTGNYWRFANFGLDYTSRLKDSFDWTAGLGYNTKGGDSWASYLQLEGNVGYNVVNRESLKLAFLTGPFVSLKVKDNFDNYVCPGNADINKGYYAKMVFGWQFGVGLSYRFMSLKLGYERPITSIFNEKYMDYMDYKYTPYELFIRLGVRF